MFDYDPRQPFQPFCLLFVQTGSVNRLCDFARPSSTECEGVYAHFLVQGSVGAQGCNVGAVLRENCNDQDAEWIEGFLRYAESREVLIFY